MIPIAEQAHFMRTMHDLADATYPLQVLQGKLTRETADKELALMAAVLRTLEWCERNKPLIVEIKKSERRAA